MINSHAERVIYNIYILILLYKNTFVIYTLGDGIVDIIKLKMVLKSKLQMKKV